jgi:DNA-binding MarR family transcriptional regulator
MNEERRDFERLMEMINQVTAKMGAMHEPALDFGTGVPLYRVEIHTIKTLGDNPGINMTGLAERMGVTKGAVSQTINKLASKGLVVKAAADDNAREILPELTELGRKGYDEHERYHMMMFDAVREYYGDRFKPELERFVSVMTDLNHILDRFDEKGLYRPG